MSSRPRLLLSVGLRMAALVVLCGLGIHAGWTQLWLFGLATLSISIVNMLVLRRYNPDLLWERMKPNRAPERFDRFALAAIGLSCVSTIAAAGLDVLVLQWTVLPPEASVAAVFAWFLGTAPITWSMAVNPYLIRTVQHQPERGHAVVSTGPYRFVRHPMYTGMSILFLGLGPLLGSGIAVLPSLLTVAALVYRTVHEDALLHRTLEGYAAFAQRTPYRIVPFVW